MLDEGQKKKLLARLARAEGQVCALKRMIEQDAYCVDVLIQTSAVQGALGRIGEIVLARHMETCVSEAFDHGDHDDRQQKISELIQVFSRYARMGAR